MPTNLGLENQLDSTQNSSYFSLSFRHWDCTANGWELRSLNLQFNFQSRLAIFSKWSTIHITGFLGDVFESAAADKWPEVTRRMTRRITWSWSPYPAPALVLQATNAGVRRPGYEARCKDSRTAKSTETREGWSHKTNKYTDPLQESFHNTRISKKICRGFVYLFVLCDHPSLVSVVFAVLLSLHLVTF